MIGFQLWREYKLSVSEILSVFPQWKTVFLSTDFLIIENVTKDDVLFKANKLGWTIKIIEISNNSTILEDAMNSEVKFKYGLSLFWEKKNLKTILMNMKKELKWQSISSRFINKDFKNLSSAQILWEKLVKTLSDYTQIYTENKTYYWKSIWVQDIYNYSKRDWQKDRDMQTGMLPPKLCQIMLNISWGKTIYDPFVWLGTVLIESILIWNKEVYWSDLSQIMVDNTTNNINWFINRQNIQLNNVEIIKLNSKFIHESEILLNKTIDSIVTEWYLGEMMTQKNISIDRINKQKDSLSELYDRFFTWLKNINYNWNLVICFPFWEMKWKYTYFTEIYDIIDKYCEIESLFPNNYLIESTKSGSLLYKRDKQLVWREIFKLKVK